MKHYDLALSWNSGAGEKFVKWLRGECRIRALRFLLINEKNVESVISELEKSKIKIGFLLDNEADYDAPNNLYARLSYAVKDADGYVTCDPDDARQSANKAVTHYDLLKAKIPVPYTVVVRNWEPDDFILSKDEIKRLGAPFIIKPASGFGQKGVIKEASGDISEIAKARHFNRGDNFLLQEKIEPVYLDKKQAWFRVYFLFGEIMPCWWDTVTGHYSPVTLREMYNYKLLPLARIISEIARIANMDFFSSEIALTMSEKKEKRFVAIDYVNDQPELCVRSEKTGGPIPEIVEHVAQRIAEMAWRLKLKNPIKINRSIWLAKAITEDESI